jgi:exonuclease SbcC
MRILSIAGQNLASLAERFEIDFAAAPLSGAGLFAITGETGAGKSSVLDAMCLALYGDAPRLAQGVASDKVPDPAGDQINAHDPRSMLRRGAATGWAKVRFTGSDGEDYEAGWTARRARDRADGRLQQAGRSLVRLSDGASWGQATDVDARIVALTGLSYAEFRRTVLLAQGDFDAFLRADTNERAALLEKITGTGRYRRISVAVRARHDAATNDRDGLLLRRGEHRLMPEDERLGRQEEQAALHARLGETAARRAALAAARALHGAHATAAARLAEAEAAATRARTDSAGAGADRDRLALHDRAEPLRAGWQAADNAARQAVAAGAARERAEIAVAAAETAATAAGAGAAAAQAAHDAAEAGFKDYAPLWDRAADLDSQIRQAGVLTAQAEAAAKTAGDTATEAAARHAALAAQEAQARTAADTATTDLARLAAALPLADRWDEAQRALRARDAAGAERTTAEARAAEQEQAAAEVETALEGLDDEDSADRENRERILSDLQGLTAARDTLDTTRPQARLAAVTQLADRLGELDRAAEAWGDAVAGQDAAAGLVAEAETRAAAAGAEGDAFRSAAAMAEAQVAALSAPAERAGLAVSDMARHLRQSLAAGEPCPVCGATDHPAADAALAAIAASLRADLDTARETARTAQAGALAAGLTAARATAARDAALREAETAAAQARTALDRWTKALPAARALDGCPLLPDRPERLPKALDQVAALRNAAADDLDRLDGLRRQISALDGDRDGLTRRIDARGADRNGLTERLADHRRQALLARGSVAEQDRRLAEAAAILSPLLDPLDPAADPAALVAAVADARSRAATAAALLADLAPRLATAAESDRQAAVQAANLANLARTRQDEAAMLQSDRAGLLGGEATESHRTRINAQRLAAQTAAVAARDADAEARRALAEVLGRVAAARTEAETAVAALAGADARLTADCRDAGLDPAALAPLLSTPRGEIDAQRLRLRALDNALTAAEAALAQRAADLAAATAALPAESAATLDTALAEADRDSQTGQQRLGAIATELAEDDRRRALLADLETAIAAAEADLAVWKAVDAAVGSANGDRFARIAQRVTLDVLVDSANHHLADLNPRYRLRRAEGLSLQVEDRDMGNEPRATRSLSGGERFLVSLALALALSRMGGRGGLAGMLFIDEGFGALDAESLDLAIDALERLQSQGRSVGVISHVEAMKDRIPVRIRVQKQGGGRSVVRVEGSG